uniref:Uncharacterized protein n=1 Tax=Oryza sativa subsp. japonica TaxID=39947 RepID=Q653W5_ORYSJ|nr:hypothetical protein [Oryza sativa Japonica Group]
MRHPASPICGDATVPQDTAAAPPRHHVPALPDHGTDAVPQGPQWCRSFNMREQPGWRLRL